jgi:hypothetical protein
MLAMVALGGWRSQIIWNPASGTSGLVDDERRWRYHTEKLGPFKNEEEFEVRIGQMADETTELLKHHWFRVEALALASLERNPIPGEEAERPGEDAERIIAAASSA